MFTLQQVSDAERRFLLDGVAQGIRNDGRGYFDYRRVSFEIGSIPTATASCRLRAGETDLLVGVKSDVMKPSVERPDAGHFQISVECSPSVSVALAERWQSEDWSRRLSVILETLCGSEEAVDRKALCIVPGRFAWDVRVDVLVLHSGGNLLDSASQALYIALSDTLLPKVEVSEAMEDGELVQLQVDHRPEVGTAFPLWRLPLCVTVAQLQGQFLLDVTPEEELCSDAMLCVVLDAKEGNVIGLHKLGRGLFDVAALPVMIDRCRATAAALVQQLDRELSLKDADA